MKRLMATIISTLLLSALTLPAANAQGLDIATCPVDGDRCVGFGGSAGR